MTGPRPGERPVRDPRQLLLIRAAHLAGVLMFGGVTYWLHHRGDWSPPPVDAMLVYLPMAAIPLALVGMC